MPVLKKNLLSIAFCIAFGVHLAGQGDAAEPVILQLRWDHQFQFAGYYAAQWNGYYTDAGLAVTIQSAVNAEQKILSATREVAEGRAAFGIGGADILLANDNGVEMTVLASLFQQSSARLFHLEEIAVHSLGDLIGLRIARTPDDLIDIELQAMLLAEGIDPDRLTTVVHVPGMAHLLLREADVIPGYTLTMPYRAKELGLTVRSIAPAAYGVNFYGDSLFARRAFVRKNPDLTTAFKNASLKGWQYAMAHPNEIADRISRDLPRHSPVDDLHTFNRFQAGEVEKLTLYPVVEIGHINPDRWQRMHSHLVKIGLIHHALKLDDFIFDPVRDREARIRKRNAILLIGLTLAGVSATIFLVWVQMLRRAVAARTRSLSEANASLEENKRKFETIFQHTPLLISISDAEDGRHLNVNDAFTRHTGYSPESVIGRRWQEMEMIAAEDRERIAALLASHGQVKDLEIRLTRSDGETLTCLFSGILIEVGGRQRLLSIAADITSRKRAERILKDSEQKWRNILIHTPQIGISLDPGARIVFANDRFLRLTGWERSDVIGQNWFDMFIPDQVRNEVRTVFDMVMGQKDTLGYSTYENEIVTRTGAIKNIAWSNVLTKGPEGYVIDVTCLGVDLTERKQAEKALWETTERFRKVFNSQIDAIFVLSSDRPAVILECNDAATAIFQHKKEALIGGSVELLHIDPDHLSRFQKILRAEFAASGRLNRFEFEMKRSGGEIFPTEHTVAELTDDTGKRFGWISVVRDLTEQKKAEERLRQAQRMESIGNLAGGIAHDFNNLLFPIVGMAEMLMEDLPAGSLPYENAAEILKAGKRGRDLVRQILTFSRQTGQKLVPVRMEQVLREVLRLSRAIIPMNIEITHSIEAGCSMVNADTTQIHQVVMNLMTNACHAAAETEGTISVRLSEKRLDAGDLADTGLTPGKYVILTVADTGPGIPAELREKIFEPYFTTKETGKGTGLGLATAYGIVKEHHGDIRVESEYGKGAAFHIYLPAIDRDARPDVVDTPADLPRGRERILLVDDEPAIVKLEKQILSRLGYTVTVFSNCTEALKWFQGTPHAVDLAITDMSMPQMTGDQLARELAAIRPDLPVIICTGFSERISPETAAAIGIRGFLNKPVVKAELAGAVRQVLDGNKSQD